VADGVAIIFTKTQITNKLIGGGAFDLGYAGIKNSFGIEFDTE